MTFQQLIFVNEVAACASFNKAAEKLYTHQSNVSKSIRQLEEELGIQIFSRTQKGVSVTEEGLEFLTYAQELLSKKQFVENMYTVRQRNRPQCYRISSMRAFFLSDPIIRMQEMLGSGERSQYFRLSKDTFDDVLDNVSSNRADLGIVFVLKSHVKKLRNTVNIKNLNCFELGESHINIVLREDHPILSSGSLDNISDYPYVIVEEDENFGQLYDESSKSIFELFHTLPRTILSTNDSMACQNIIAGTDAFFISSTPYRHTKHYQFASIPLGGYENILTYFYVLRKDQELCESTGAFIKALTDMFDERDTL